MKKYIVRVVALLILASATLPGCSVEYRAKHHGNNGRGNGNGHGHGHDRDNHYRNY